MRSETDSVTATRIRLTGDRGPDTVTTGDMFPRDMTAPPDRADLLESIIEWAVELLRVDDGEIRPWDQAREELRLSISHVFIFWVNQGKVLRYE